MEEKQAPRRATLFWFLALLAGALLDMGLLLLSFHTQSGTVYLILSYAAQLCSLFIIFAGFGAAFYHILFRRARSGYGCIALAALCYALPIALAAFQQIRPYLPTAYAVEAWRRYGLSAGLNILLYTAFLFAAVGLCQLLFLRRGRPDMPVRLFSLRDPLCRTQGFAALLALALKLCLQIPETVAIVEDLGRLYADEVAAIVFDYVFLFVSVLLGYLIEYMVTLMFLYEDVKDE